MSIDAPANDFVAERFPGWNREASLAIETFQVVQAGGYGVAELLAVDWRDPNSADQAKLFLAHIGIKNFVHGLPYYDLEPNIILEPDEIIKTGKGKEYSIYELAIPKTEYNLVEKRAFLPFEGTIVASYFRARRRNATD